MSRTRISASFILQQVLNRACWSPLQASRHLLKLIIETFGQAGGTLDIVIDETLERRWGPKIRKRGHYRDSARSSHKRSVSSPGLRWIVLDRAGRGGDGTLDPAALGLALSVCAGHHSSGERAVGDPPQNARLAGTSGRQPAAALVARSADQAARRPSLQYPRAWAALYHAADHADCAVSPRLYDSPTRSGTRSPHHPHTIGRPRVVGPRLPSLEHVLSDPETVWERLTLHWYGEGPQTLEWCTGTACWYRFGSTPLPIRWVLTRDPAGKRPPKALFSTNQAQPAEEIIGDFMKRWSLETTFEESRAHLGSETQRQWSDRAIERTPPLLFGLYSLVPLFGSALAPEGHPPHRHAAWYHKPAATFSDILALVRRHLWGNFVFPTSRSNPNVVLLPRSTLQQLAHAACY